MNYALLPPTAHAAVADRVDCEFRSLDVAAHATALAFDAGGHYLAAGYGDGSLLVWDLCLRGGAALRRAEAIAAFLRAGLERRAPERGRLCNLRHGQQPTPPSGKAGTQTAGRRGRVLARQLA